MRGKIAVAGFRPGKAPRKMIEKMYGVEVFFEEAINIAFPEAYEAALKEKELQVVGYPEVDMLGECTVEGFTFTAIVPVYPEVTLGEYKGLSAITGEVKVTEDDVALRLNDLAERQSRLVTVTDRAAMLGDTAVIDFEGFLEGVPFEGGKGENHNLELGSGTFVPGFEEQVIGMQVGEEKDLDITFPEQYTPELAGKAVVFKVKLNEIKCKEMPELDDEFAKDVSEFDTLEELKADLEKKIAEEQSRAAEQAFTDALMAQVAENLTVEIPDAMIETQCKQFIDNFKMQLAQQGIPYEEYLKMTGTEESALLEEAKKPAEDQVRMDLAMAAIIKAENLTASDEEVEAEYKKMAEQYSMDIEMVKKYLQAEQVRDELISRKATLRNADSDSVITTIEKQQGQPMLLSMQAFDVRA